MSLSELSIRRPVFAWILMFGLIFFGFLAFRQMGINENPDVDFPTISINYIYDGATPEVIEKDVIEPVESVLVSMEGITKMDSVAERNSARITLEFDLNRNIDFALQEAQTLLGRAQRLLPDSIESPTVTKANADDEPILYLSLVAEGFSYRDHMILFRDRVRDQFATVEGVAEVRPFGYHEPVMRVDLDAKKLARYQLTANDIVASIRREHKELPAGKFELGDQEDLIRIKGEAGSQEEFANMVISRRGGSPNFAPLRLRDVATIYEGVENIRRISRVNGQPALAMAIHKQRGVNAAATADRVKARIQELNKDMPKGAQLLVNFDRTQFIRESVEELVFTLLLSALLTSLVCWIFLGSWSATANILLAIPTSIVGAFIFINWLGFTLNAFSLLGLALAIGIVVDDAIIVLENIVRYAQMGFDKVNAAYKGSREITFAVIATTIALIAIFVPVSFMPGIEGRFFFEFAVTISIAVGLSSLEALTLAPMRCSQFLETGHRSSWFGRSFDQAMEQLSQLYGRTLRVVLERRAWVVVGAVLLVAGSVFLFRNLDTEFVPAQDRGMLSVSFLAPDGKSMQYTSEKVKEYEKIVSAHPAVERVFVAVGGFGAGGQGNRGNGIIVLKDRKLREQSQAQVIDQLRAEIDEKVKGLKVFIRDRFGPGLGGRRGNQVEFTLSGPDPEKQKELFEVMKSKMEESGMFVGLRSDDVRGLPEIQVVPNRERAIRSGVEVSEVADVVNATFGGVVATNYTQGGRRFQVFVQLQEQDRRSVDNLRPILVRNNRGELLPLSQVVDVTPTSSPQLVYREDRIRGVRVDGSLVTGVTEGRSVDKIKQIAAEVLPEKYFVRFAETPQEKIKQTMIIMVLGLIIAYMVLASQFNSFVDPLVVFLAIPFGLIGSALALLLGGQTLNVYSAIGLLLTMGIVKKNSILLVEFSNQLRDRGQSVREAVLQACPIRLRPILMTTVSTLAAALPPAFAIGPGAETRVPMALTVIGGVIVSALFTLFVVPCVYSYVSPQRRKILLETDDSVSARKPLGSQQVL